MGWLRRTSTSVATIRQVIEVRSSHRAVGAVGATNTRNDDDDGEVRTHANGRRCPEFGQRRQVPRCSRFRLRSEASVAPATPCGQTPLVTRAHRYVPMTQATQLLTSGSGSGGLTLIPLVSRYLPALLFPIPPTEGRLWLRASLLPEPARRCERPRTSLIRVPYACGQASTGQQLSGPCRNSPLPT